MCHRVSDLSPEMPDAPWRPAAEGERAKARRSERGRDGTWPYDPPYLPSPISHLPARECIARWEGEGGGGKGLARLLIVRELARLPGEQRCASDPPSARPSSARGVWP